MRHAAGEENGVEESLERGSHCANLFGDLVNHCVENQGRPVFSGANAFFDEREIFSSEIGIEAPLAEQHGFDLCASVLPRIAQIDERHDRYCAGTLGGESTFFTGVGDVYHATVLVSGDGNAAADM